MGKELWEFHLSRELVRSRTSRRFVDQKSSRSKIVAHVEIVITIHDQSLPQADWKRVVPLADQRYRFQGFDCNSALPAIHHNDVGRTRENQPTYDRLRSFSVKIFAMLWGKEHRLPVDASIVTGWTIGAQVKIDQSVSINIAGGYRRNEIEIFPRSEFVSWVMS